MGEVQLVFSTRKSPKDHGKVRVAFYLVALLVLGYHLRHGFQSAFQTFGLHHGRYAKLIKALGVVFWLFVPLGFALIPLAVLWSH